MQQPLISIIVPVYKVEQYLHKTIGSVLAQTYTNWELLLIDDGSPDNSGAICDEYAEKDNRIKVFHKKNGGVSSARNVGLDNASGVWVAFLDSDDYIRPNTYADFVAAVAENSSLDHFIQGYTKGKICVRFPDGVFNITDTFRLTNETAGCCCGYIWHRYFRRSLIGNLRFDENMSFAEDGVFWFNYMSNIKTTAFLSSIGYDYYVTNGISLTSKYIEEPTIEYVLKSFMQAFILIDSNVKDSTLKSYTDIFLAKKTLQYAYRGVHSSDELRNKEYFEKFLTFAKFNLPKVRAGLSIRERFLQYLLFSNHYLLFRTSFRFMQKLNGLERRLGI